MAMSYSRHQQMLQSIPANARKVYEVIPITEAWSYSQIHQEMQRTGHNMRTEIIMGCVSALKDAGLVHEASQHRFQRSPHKPKPDLRDNIIEEGPVANEVQPIKTKPRTEASLSPADKIAALASQLRELGKTATNIADDMDDVALVLEEHAGQEAGALAELRRMREALKVLLPGS